MNVKKCAGGHFFDADKYQLCPHCGASIEEIREVDKPAETKSEGSRFSPRKQRRHHLPAEVTPLPQKTMGKTFGVFEEKPQQLKPSKVVRDSSSFVPKRDKEAKKPSENKSAEIYMPSQELFDCPLCGHKTSVTSKYCRYCGSDLSAQRPKTPEKPTAKQEDNEIFSFSENKRTPPQEKKAVPAPVQPTAAKQERITSQPDRSPDEDDRPPKGSLEAAVRSAISAADGKTIGFFSMGTSETQNDAEPVVGWLVCVKGKHFGESFPIAAGRNATGRSPSNKIVLHKDNAVSREKHAWITYDPKNRDFFLQPGEGSGLTYLNGEIVMEYKKLGAMDKIELGEGMYLLVPLCGENFSWETYM